MAKLFDVKHNQSQKFVDTLSNEIKCKLQSMKLKNYRDQKKNTEKKREKKNTRIVYREFN